jgi:hypothetical protein
MWVINYTPNNNLIIAGAVVVVAGPGSGGPIFYYDFYCFFPSAPAFCLRSIMRFFR